MNLIIIAAVSENQVIGINGQLPWKLPADLQHFKKVTSGHPVIMGKNTFVSIGRPLPNRTNIVISSTLAPQPGIEVFQTLQNAVDFLTQQNFDQAFVIGGSALYKESLAFADTLLITHVHANVTGDTFFPTVNWKEWNKTSQEEITKDDQNEYGATITTYKRLA